MSIQRRSLLSSPYPKSIRLLTIFILLMTLVFTLNHATAADNTVTVPHTAAIDLSQALNWSDTATWPAGIPQAGDDVMIPAGQTVIVDVPSIDVNSISVPMGAALVFQDADIQVRTRYISVMGALQIGTALQPITHQITLTFTGDDPGANDIVHAGFEHGTKGLFVMGTGTLDIHGQPPSHTWTHLNAHAQPGSQQITVADPVNWQVGDEIVIASTDFDAHQAEEMTITAVNGQTLTLDRPLQHFHYGETQTYGGRVIENRAEVGLLTRNIRIQGEQTSAAPTFGAQTMFMRGTTIRIDSLELTNAGQEAILARYPLHFHLAKDMSTSYIRNSSVHHSFNRGLTIHGTDSVLVQDNVFYDVIGNTVFFEDAVERFNIVERNLVVLTRTPDSPIIPSDAGTFGPASYWISSPNNILRDNVAAGSEGTGFWFDLPEAPTGSSTSSTLQPRHEPIGEFSGNLAHSNAMIGIFSEPYFPTEHQYITDVTAYKNHAHGLWSTANGQLMDGGYIIVENGAFLDNGTGTLMPGGGTIRNSVYVGASGNAASTEQRWDDERPMVGHRFYSGPTGVEDSIFINYQSTADYPAGAISWRVNLGEGRDQSNYVEGLTFENANEAYFVHTSWRGSEPTDISYESMAFEDRDGSMGGQPFSMITTAFPLSYDADDTFMPDWNGYITNNPVGLVRIGCGAGTCPTTVIRDDGARADIGQDGRFHVAMNREYTVYHNDTSCNWDASLNHEYGGDYVMVASPYTCTVTNMETMDGPMVAGSSYDDVLASTKGDVYYHDTSNNMLYFKLVQPQDNIFEELLKIVYFDYVRVNGSGTNQIVTPPDGTPTPEPQLNLNPIALVTNSITPVEIDIMGANQGVSLDMSTLTVQRPPSWGEAVTNDPVENVIMYTPDGVYIGEDTFAYSVCDTSGLCGSASVTITINDVDPTPQPTEPIATVQPTITSEPPATTEPTITPVPPTPTPLPPNTPNPLPTGDAEVSGELRQWHRVALTFDGPQGSENDAATFWNYRLMVTFSNGGRSYTVPGFFAADGDAANTGATSGNKWRAYFTPDAIGDWTYRASFRTGNQIAISTDPNAGTPTGFDGASGSFSVAASDKGGADFRYHGMLRYVGEHQLQFAGSGDYYLKSGADSPENFLAYDEFDGTYDTGGIQGNFLHRYQPHVADWQPGDPLWSGDRGRGIIGALNYLAMQGVNSVYFLTYNIDGGDGSDTWPWVDDTVRDRFDVSKLDQWEIVFSHMTAKGIQLHVVTQETENDGDLGGNGNLNAVRQLYYRELVARFGHHPALQWNIGEENSNGPQQQKDFAAYIRSWDAYEHPIAIHSNYNAAEFLYNGLYGNPNYEVTSIQGDGSRYNEWAIEFRENSAAAGRPWAIYGDEQGPAVASNMGNLDELREDTLWGNLMGGGAGVEWYFGYQNNFGDVQSEDFRPAEALWEDSRHAVDFFQNYLPFWQMSPDNSLVSNGMALALTGDTYAVYLPSGGTTSLTLADSNTYDVYWYNPRTGGDLLTGSVAQVSGPGSVELGNPPSDPNQDWAVLVQLTGNSGGNRPPRITSIDDQTMQAGEQITVPVNVTDPNGDVITLSLDGPDYASLTDNGDGTGAITLAPPSDASGTSTVTLTALDSQNANAQASFSVTVFAEGEPTPTPVIDGPAVVGFILVNADTNADIIELSDGEIIDPATIGTDQLTIRAITNPTTVGSVRFALNDNSNYITESVPPYALTGDNNGNYNAWNLDEGSYVLSAMPFTGGGASGTSGAPLTINFQIGTNNQPPATPTVLPPTVQPSATPMLMPTDLPTSTPTTVSTDLPPSTPTMTATTLPPTTEPTVQPTATTTDEPTVNQPPSIAALPDQSFAVGSAINLMVSATDADADAITLSAEGVPTFLTWTPNTDGTATLAGAAATVGDYPITVTASDGMGSKSLTFTLSVEEETAAPASVIGFTLVDAATGSDLQPLNDGDQINIDELPVTEFAIRAELSDGSVTYVNFDQNGNQTMDDSAPFVLTLSGAGEYTISATPYQGGSLMQVDTASYGYSAARAIVSIPAGVVRLSPGDDLQQIITSHPAGTAFVLSSGVYRMQTIEPRNGDQFYGEPGAVLNGSRLLTDFQQEANYWTINGQTQQGQTAGYCADGTPRCVHPEDLYLDDVPLQHVSSLAEIGPGRWFFDYGADRIYMGDNPTGRTVEVSVTRSAFVGNASDVLISNLTIEKYAGAAQSAAINAGQTTNWIVQNNIIQLNHGGGIQLGNGMAVYNNYVVNNGQIGISGIGDNIRVEYNDIGRNNYAGYDSGWEGGGTKFVLTDGLIVRRNYVYENQGPGLWTDIDNINTLYEENLVMNNERMGIFHEISDKVTIRNNVVMFNSVEWYPWLYGAQIQISSSSNGLVYGNRVVVSEYGGNSIGIIQQERGSGPFGVRQSNNNEVRDNTVVYMGAVGQGGAAADWNGAALYADGNTEFNGNDYFVAADNVRHWRWDSEYRWDGFQAVGQEENGTLNTLNAGMIPGSSLTITFSLVSDNATEGVPSAPTDVTAEAISSSEISVTWVDTATNELIYEIRRDGATTEPLASDTTQYIDSGLTSNTAYCYEVRAVNDAGESEWSESVCATTQDGSGETPLSVIGLVLVNADTNQDIGPLNDGDVLNLALLPTTNLSVRAEVSDDIQSVRFGLNENANLITENVAPFAMTGDNNGDYNAWTPEIGSYTLTVTGFTDTYGNGTASSPYVVAFTVVEDDAATPITPTATVTPTVTPVTPSPTPITPTATPVTPTATPEQNLPPTISNPGEQSGKVGEPVNLTISAIDPEGAAMRFTATDLPPGLQMDQLGGVISGAPTSAGSFNTTITVLDAGGLSESITFAWVIEPGATAPTMGIAGLVLVNADTNQDIGPLQNGGTINLAQLPTDNLNVRAEVNGDVKSVRFGLNNNANVITENVAPYALRGDNNGNYNAWTPDTGNYTLTVTGFTDTYGNGTASSPYVVAFTVIDQGNAPTPTPVTLTVIPIASPIVPTATPTPRPTASPAPAQPGGLAMTGIMLVNADTNQDIMLLTNNQVINLGELGTQNIALRAVVQGAAGSVRFVVNTTEISENAAPYTYPGDTNGDYRAWSPGIGMHTITAQPYPQAYLNGTPGTGMTLTIQISN